ncbi:MAG: peptidylprolyl isomerase [Candidatus Omnitrophica bacterium]|nr:peptidylprolyl isomerase [Candidatus Omnitrophota bacterium]
MTMKKILTFCFAVSVCLVFNFVYGAEPAEKKTEFAGEFFGAPVPIGNYYFVKGVIMVFGNRFGPQPQTAQELEDCVWDGLLLSYEAFRRNITVSQEEIENEIAKIIKDEKVEFDRKKDREAYAQWVKKRVNEPVELFENQIRYLIQLEKLRKEVMKSIKPEVSAEEAYQKFLNEYNTLAIELVQFDQLKDARDFYQKAEKNSRFWDKEKEKRPKDFKRPGFVALEFLMEMWKLPKDAVYKMMQMEIGRIYPPAPIYKGYGVFKVLEKRPAEETKYPQLKQSYFEKVRMKKKYEGFNNWLKDLKQSANIKISISYQGKR